MAERIWIADWELQCCGAPFAVGDEVRWRLSPAGEQAWLSELLGQEAALDAFYDHHMSEDVPEFAVTVGGIEAVFCTYRQHGRTLTPVPGSGSRQTRSSATGWVADHGDARFVGYLVEGTRI